MSQMTAFIEQAKSDGELMAKLDALGVRNAGPDEVIALAAEYGFTVTKEDVEAARRRNCPHHGELNEEDLDAVSGGATENRYDANVCHGLTEARYECVGFLQWCWCDHYRETELARTEDEVMYAIKCAMGCFSYEKKFGIIRMPPTI